MPNPYSILGLSPNASEKDVKSAYRKLAKQYHPDVNKDPGAEAKFKEISQAYEDILNPKPQQQINDSGFNPFGGFDFSGFGDFFNQRPAHDPPLVFELDLTPEEAFKKFTKTLRYNKNYPCSGCSGQGGTGNVSVCLNCMGAGRIIKAIHQGMYMLQQDLGPCSACNGSGKKFELTCNQCHGNRETTRQETLDIEIKPGIVNRTMMIHDKNIMVSFVIKSDKFKADNNFNMYTEMFIDPIEALLGKSIIFQHPNGTKLKINTKKNLEHMSEVIIKNKGFPASEFQYGDLVVKFLYKNPTNVSEEEENILRSYLELREKRNKNEYD